jgi:hypothetical protein
MRFAAWLNLVNSVIVLREDFDRPGESHSSPIHYDGKNIEKSTFFYSASFFALVKIKATT